MLRAPQFNTKICEKVLNSRKRKTRQNERHEQLKMTQKII